MTFFPIVLGFEYLFSRCQSKLKYVMVRDHPSKHSIGGFATEYPLEFRQMPGLIESPCVLIEDFPGILFALNFIVTHALDF